MVKKETNKQALINKILIISVVLLAAYAAVLTYLIFVYQSSNESVDQSLAESIFKMQVEQATKELNQ